MLRSILTYRSIVCVGRKPILKREILSNLCPFKIVEEIKALKDIVRRVGDKSNTILIREFRDQLNRVPNNSHFNYSLDRTSRMYDFLNASELDLITKPNGGNFRTQTLLKSDNFAVYGMNLKQIFRQLREFLVPHEILCGDGESRGYSSNNSQCYRKMS